MKVIRKRPGEEPEVVELDNTPEALQKEVGGEPEFIRFSTDAAGVVCKSKRKLPPNTTFCGHSINGTLLVIGWDGKQASGLPNKFVNRTLSWLGRKSLWRS